MSYHFDSQHLVRPVKPISNGAGDVGEAKLQDHSLGRKLKDATAAFLGGVAQVGIGQPLDLIKVLIQTGKYQNSYQAITQVYKSEGLLAFYKGSAVPLIGVGFINTIMFNFCYKARRLTYAWQQKELSMPQYYITGSVAGSMTSVITSPVEQIRILLQTNKFKTTASCFKHLVNVHGFSHGVFNGLTLTALRDAHSHGIWFLSFEYLMKWRQETAHITRDAVPTWQLLLFGALAGDLLWLTTYPVDVVKTIKQSNIGTPTRQIVQQIYRQAGWKGFWNGIGPTLIRAAPVNAGVFATVELCLRVLG